MKKPEWQALQQPYMGVKDALGSCPYPYYIATSKGADISWGKASLCSANCVKQPILAKHAQQGMAAQTGAIVPVTELHFQVPLHSSPWHKDLQKVMDLGHGASLLDDMA
eukprot:1156328-Pelagomonas_calceolata.AAC.3